MSSMFCKKIYICKNSGWCDRDFNPESDDPECFELKTNYDLVMEMGIEQLAEFLGDDPTHDICPNNCHDDLDRPCKVCVLEWLKKGVSE